ncbi:MAG: TIGR02757 family protein [Phycisphaerae bacterium]|nr:TIGR02757 family protein [Phycisphaerae bacterium]
MNARADMLESLYRKLNRRRYVHPDPLEFLYKYESPGDREIVALVASSLAYGRVAQILKSVSTVLEGLGARPMDYLLSLPPGKLSRVFKGFRHRFDSGRHVAAMLRGARRVVERYGSLEACFAEAIGPGDATVLPAMQVFVGRMTELAGGDCGSLLPAPARGSACKRLNLMLRWLVRRDEVDPGGWSCVRPGQLIVPLDTHMHKIALALGMTKRKTADMTTALEVTAAFRKILPDDPVRYDFALTRLGIRDDMDIDAFIENCEG